jgi:dihydrofolate reductase
MRKVIVSIEVTLDGVMQKMDDPKSWILDYMGVDDAVDKYQSELLMGEADALIMGRETYDGFRAYWPRQDKNEFVARMNSIPKYVASHTLSEPLTWNATLLKDVVEDVKQLKQSSGKAIVQYGIGELTYTLIEHGLVDELRIMVYPVVVSEGPRIFENTKRVPMKLLDTKKFPSGVVLSTYQPEHAK